jgi:hypothetical protein
MVDGAQYHLLAEVHLSRSAIGRPAASSSKGKGTVLIQNLRSVCILDLVVVSTHLFIQ